jgi:ATP citrate (pro-S)-lyase
MSAKAITEYDGKRILAKWLLSPPSFSSSQSTGNLTFAPSTKLARVNLDFENNSHPYKPSAENSTTSAAANNAAHELSLKKQVPEKSLVQAKLSELFAALEKQEPWLLTDKLVVKPDQLIKRRGKLGLLGINLDWAGVKQWISERAGAPVQVTI